MKKYYLKVSLLERNENDAIEAAVQTEASTAHVEVKTRAAGSALLSVLSRTMAGLQELTKNK